MRWRLCALNLLIAVSLSAVRYATSQTCEKPDLNPNVVISPDKSSYGFYEPASVSCSDGSTISGPAYGYCVGSDTWSPDITTSTCPVSCGPPAVGSGGVIIDPDDTSYDPADEVQFSCSQGGVTGPSSATCESDGSWNYVGTGLPSCQAVCTAPDNTNGTGTYSSGEVLLFQCMPGYSLQGSADAVTTTCNDGTWNPPVDCVSSGCPPPEVPEGVDYVGSTTSDDEYFDQNQRVDLECGDDKTPIGPEFSYCNSTNQWDPDPMLLSCYDKCQTPDFNDTRVIHTSKSTGEAAQEQIMYDHTETILLSCEGGLFVDGPWRTVCNEGTWSGAIGGDLPMCRANCTGPTYSDVEGELFRHGEVHIFQCATNVTGIVRLGGPRAFCNDGAWKPNVRCALKTEL